MRVILGLNVDRDESLGDGQPPVWIDAFGSLHPIYRELAKLMKKSIYDDTLFSPIARQNAVLIIMMRILYVTTHGGWLYMNTNEAALKSAGGIDMVDYILGLYEGTDHPKWKVVKRCIFGATARCGMLCRCSK